MREIKLFLESMTIMHDKVEMYKCSEINGRFLFFNIRGITMGD